MEKSWEMWMMENKKKNYAIPEKPQEIKKFASIGLFIAIIIASGIFTKFSIKELVLGLDQAGVIIKKMFLPPNWEYFDNLMKPMADTIQMSVIGTIIGSIIAIPFAVLSARNFIKSKIITGFFRNFLGIFRTIPALVFAAVFAMVFGFTTFSGMLSLAVFTFGMVAKLIYDAIEGIDPGPVEALEASGGSKINILRYAIIPQILPQFLSFVLYAFEINIRSASILGYVGAGGIGVFYSRNINFGRWDRVGSIVILTFIVVLITDLLSARLREELV